MLKYQKKVFRYIVNKAISAFAQNNGSSAELDFIYAVLEAINYFVFE